MARLEVRLFGHLEFAVDGVPWRFSAPPRAAVVFGYLLLHAGESISRSALATLLWPDDAEEEARGKLRRHLHRIARGLPPSTVPWIAVTPSTVRWDARADANVDLHEFERAAADPLRREEAIALYRGDLLEDLYEDWILVDRERLRSIFLELCYEASLQARRNRDFDASIRYAERMLAADEWREDALRMAMAARYESGDRSGALAAFERFNAKLRSEMRVEPMVETIALRSAILENGPVPGAVVPDDDAAAAGPAKLPFVGRRSEMETLDALWVRAARGHGTMLFLGGAAGIGKSRLMSELGTTVGAQGGRTLVGGTSNPEAYPYEPVADALRRGLSLVAQSKIDRVWLSSLAALIPELYGALPDLPPAESLEPAHARQRLFEAIVRCAEQLARVRPLFVVFEDVHWAQTATLDALEFLARRIGMLPVFAVATYRIEEVDPGHAVASLKNRLQAERRAVAMVLRPLESADVTELVARSQAGAPADLTESICILSEGNPLFAGQLLRAYGESGERPSEESAVRTISDAIVTRYRSLDPAARRLAETAAACGRSFTVDFAARVMGCREDEVLDGLGVLLDRGMVREAGGTAFAYAFTHALIGAAIYDATPPEFRIARHRRIAQLLAANADAGAQSWASIARHWEAAGDRSRAADAFVRAARAALEVHARQEAIAYAHSALKLADNDAMRFTALEVAATAEMRSSDIATWDRDLRRMEALAPNLGYNEELTALKLRDRYASQVGDVSLKAQTVERMFELARRSGSPAVEMEALIAKGGLGMVSVDVAIAREALARALEIASSSGNADGIVRSRELLIQVLVRFGDGRDALEELKVHRAHIEREGASIERRLSILNPESIVAAQQEDGAALERIGCEMRELAARAGDSYFEARAHTVLAHSSYIRQDYAGIRRHYQAAIPLFEQLGDMRSLHTSYINWSEFELRVGQVQTAMRLLEQTYPYTKRLKLPDGDVVYAVNRALALLLSGSLDEALESARRAEAMSASLSEPRFLLEASIALSAVESLKGLTQTAISRLERVVARCLGSQDWHNASDGLCWLIDAYVASGEPRKAESHGERLAQILAAHPDAAVHATRICWTLSRLSEAIECDKEAREWRERGIGFLNAALAKFDNPGDVEAFSGLPFNRALLAHANGRETRTAPRSS